MEKEKICVYGKNIFMKKVLLGCLVWSLVSISVGQTAAKKEETKFTPPVIRKDKPKTKQKAAAKFTVPLIVKEENAKFTPPVIQKKKTAKKRAQAKFTPPVIVKDKAKR